MQTDLFTADAFARFQEFHRENPTVWKLFEQYAVQAIRSGRRHYSARTIMERVRWHSEIQTTGDAFKINNNHIPFYARMFAQAYPEHGDFFAFRDKRAA